MQCPAGFACDNKAKPPGLEAAIAALPAMDLPLGLILKKIVGALLKPPLLPLLLVALGLLLMRWRPRVGRGLAWAGLGLALFLSTPFTVALMTRPLERFPAVQPAQLANAQAIVILAGGQRAFTQEYQGPAPSRLTLERLRYGARLARQSKLPVLLSGGNPTCDSSEARVMDEALQLDFNLRAQWVEDRSLDTADNARLSAPLLRAAGIQRIVLVTHAAHMWRASNEFRLQGFEVIPAPTAFFTSDSAGEEFFDFIPSMTSAYAGWYATHEWLGLAAQWVRVRL